MIHKRAKEIVPGDMLVLMDDRVKVIAVSESLLPNSIKITLENLNSVDLRSDSAVMVIPNPIDANSEDQLWTP